MDISRLFQKTEHAVLSYPRLVMLGCGGLLALCFAPFYFWPAALVSLPALYLSLHHASTLKQAAGRGFFYGYGFFIVGTYWIAYSLLVDASHFAWMIPFCVFGISAVLAIYFMLLGSVVAALKTRSANVNMARFVVIWGAVEYLRSYGMFGFPWNLLGYSVAFSERLSQFAAVGGVYGLSVLVLLIALFPASYVQSPQRGMKHLAASLMLVIAMYGYGMWRMPENAAPSTLRVRVVQPNIEQAMKWKPEGKVEAMRRLTQLSHIRTDAEVPGVIIWPETAMPYLLEGSENWPVMMDTFVPPGAALITGVLRKERGASRIYNSVIAVFPHGKQFVLYNKHQLVPFGEFVPLRDVLPLDKITPGNTDFSRGNGPETLATSFAGAFSALICYEAIFPDLSVAETRPEWLLNVTNDAWFGNSPGPYQHADMVRIRAIEQGLPLVRAANTGISMVVDPYGRILKSLPLGDIGIMDQTLPKSLHATVYAQNFRVTPFFLLLVGLVSLTAIRRKVTPTSQSPYA